MPIPSEPRSCNALLLNLMGRFRHTRRISLSGNSLPTTAKKRLPSGWRVPEPLTRRCRLAGNRSGTWQGGVQPAEAGL